MPGKSMKILKVIEGFKSWNMPHSQSNPISKRSVDIDEFLKSEDFSYKSLVTHGFPCEPNCIAFDPVQKLLAIGTKNGRIKIFGKSEVDYTLNHLSDSCVLQIIFLVNTGQFLSICQDDIIHLWNIKTNPPEIIGSIQFKRERISTAYLSLKSDWLYVGTERGNVNFVNTKTFTTSGYVINWNKAIEITQSVHPGKVVKIGESPQDNNKLLIGYSSGVLTLWDLKGRQAEARFKYSDNLFGFSWNFEGKTFITCHSNGILAIWNTKQPQTPVSVICPHSCNESLPTDSQLYEPIHSVEWIGTQNGEPFVIFSGGGCLTPVPEVEREDSDQKTQSFVNPLPSITVMRGKRLAVMQMDFNVVDFTTLCESPYDCDPMEPYAVSVLLESDLVVIDLLSQNYPSFENPYAIDIHISPVTAIEYVSDCPKEFIFGLYMTPKACSMMRNRSPENNQSLSINQLTSPSPLSTTESSQNDGSSFSNREWPINGGTWTNNSNQMNDNNSEIIITGHADGSIKFWNANGLSLVSVYKFRTCKLFKMNKSDWASQKQVLSKRPTDATTTNNATVSNNIVNNHFSPGLLEMEDYPLAIKFIQFCHDSRKILLGSLGSVILLKFIKDDVTEEIPFMDINSTLENFEDFYTGNNAQNDDDVMASPSEMKTFQPNANKGNKRTTSQSSYPSNSSYENKDLRVFLLLKTGSRHWSRGYQPELVCRLGVPSLSFELTSVGGANNNANNCVLPPSKLTTISFNSSFGLLAFGNESGVIIVDYTQKSIILQFAINDLYENIRPVREISRDNSGLDSFMNENSNPPPGSPYASGSNSGKLCFVAKNASVRGELKRAKSQDKCDAGQYAGNSKETGIVGQNSTPPYSASSSISSLEQYGTDSIKILHFSNLPMKKRNEVLNKNILIVGTKLGSTVIFEMNIPDNRLSQQVNAIPSGVTFRHLGDILTVDVLTQTGDIYFPPSAKWSERGVETPSNLSRQNVGDQSNSSGISSVAQSSSPVSNQTCNLEKKFGGPTTSKTPEISIEGSSYETRYLVVVSDKQIKVISFPSLSILYRVKISEKTNIIASRVSRINQLAYINCYLSNNHIHVYSLPSLRCLGDFDLTSQDKPSPYYFHLLFGRSFGLAVFMKNSRELTKISLYNETSTAMKSMMSELFIPRPMPEPLKKNFFKSLFSTSIISTPIDKNELFGADASTKNSATVVLNQSGVQMANLNERSNEAVSDIARARLAAIERGEKLSQLDQHTEEMMNQAKQYSKNASALAAKYEKKNNRWGF